MCYNTCLCARLFVLGATSHMSYFLVSVCLGVTAVFEKFMQDVTYKAFEFEF